MDEGLKKRLIGATVLVSLVVIFVPMLLEKGPVVSTTIDETNIPPPPQGDFSSQVLPLEEPAPTEAEAPSTPSTPSAPETAAPETPAPIGTIDRDKPAAATPAPQAEVEETKPATDLRVGLSAWVVQLGSFSSRKNADRVVKDLQTKKFPAFVEPAEINGKQLFRVLVGPEIDHKRAEQMLTNLEPEMKRWKLQGKLRSYP